MFYPINHPLPVDEQPEPIFKEPEWLFVGKKALPGVFNLQLLSAYVIL
ncbi:MAG: hypothetical protein ACXVI9_02670 [Mucilaginibacter sp.]